MSKILVVDDSMSVRKVVERALGTREMEVVSASSGTEAMERIEREEPDLIVSDVLMPDHDGYQICEFVKAHPRLASTPVLLISGIVNSSVLERAVSVGCDGVLGKPFEADDLVNKVDELLSRVRHPEPQPGAADDHRSTLDEELATPLTADDLMTGHPMPDLKRFLDQFVAMPGVSLAALVDREGFIIESTGDRAMDAELAGALASCLAESSTGIGRELEQGALHGMIIEYDAGVVSLHAVGGSAMLVILIVDPPVLGKVRYYAKKALPALVQAI